MTDLADHKLLSEYARTESETAFATLVNRYVNLVYSAARRFTGNSHHAEEITQAVFIILARKAGSLRRETVLSGWLYQTARLTATNFVKSEIRRQNREQETYMQSTSPEPETRTWEQIAPLLDHVMGSLNETDRNAIILRFFENKTAREIAGKLNMTEEAAHKRVNRALEKLRRLFVKRGVALSAALIAGAVASNSVQAAPGALAKAVTQAAIAKGATASASTLTLLKGALKLMAISKMKIALIAAACIVAAGTATVSVNLLLHRPIRTMPPDWSAMMGDVNAWHWTNGKINVHDDFGDALLVSGKEYGDFTLSVIANAQTREASLAFRMQDPEHGYLLIFCPPDTVWGANHPSYLTLAKRFVDTKGNQYEATLATIDGKKIASSGSRAKIEISAHGPVIEIRLNGIVVLKARDKAYAKGRIGFRTAGDREVPADAIYSDLIIRG